ncbi:MAG: hypothetical protein EOP04_33945, partial [Proteobacteria bacterium]
MSLQWKSEDGSIQLVLTHSPLLTSWIQRRWPQVALGRPFTDEIGALFLQQLFSGQQFSSEMKIFLKTASRLTKAKDPIRVEADLTGRDSTVLEILSGLVASQAAKSADAQDLKKTILESSFDEIFSTFRDMKKPLLYQLPIEIVNQSIDHLCESREFLTSIGVPATFSITRYSGPSKRISRSASVLSVRSLI